MARRAGAQHGVVTTQQAYEAGASVAQLHALVQAGVLRRLHQGTFRHVAGEHSWRTKLLAACLSCGSTAVASARSAARLCDLRDVPRWRPEVTVLDTTYPKLRGVVVHRTNRLDPEDVTVIDGIPSTSVPRTLLDLGALLPVAVLTKVVEDARFRELTSVEELLCTLERLGRPGRRGARSLRAAVVAAVPAEELESRLGLALARLLRDAGGPSPVAQHELVLPDGRTVRFDFAWPDRKLAVEADGFRWHTTKAGFERGLVRARSVAVAGWELHPFGWTDVHRHRATTLAELRRIVHGDRRAA